MKQRAFWSAMGLVLVLAVVFTALGQDRFAGRLGPDRPSAIAPDRNEVYLSATSIIVYPDDRHSIGRFDSRTGAIYRFDGDLRNTSARNTWERVVPAVKEKTSGLLEIQQIPALTQPRTPAFRERQRTQHERWYDDFEEATFLVDVVTGSTWILRLRDNANGTWDPVKIYHHR